MFKPLLLALLAGAGLIVVHPDANAVVCARGNLARRMRPVRVVRSLSMGPITAPTTIPIIAAASLFAHIGNLFSLDTRGLWALAVIKFGLRVGGDRGGDGGGTSIVGLGPRAEPSTAAREAHKARPLDRRLGARAAWQGGVGRRGGKAGEAAAPPYTGGPNVERLFLSSLQMRAARSTFPDTPIKER